MRYLLVIVLFLSLLLSPMSTSAQPALYVLSSVSHAALDGAQGLLIDGNIAYVHGATVNDLSKPGHFSVWDLNFTPPKLLSSFDSMYLRGSPHSMGKYQDHIFTMASNNGTPWRDAGIVAINVSVPSAPYLASVLYDPVKLEDAHAVRVDPVREIAWTANSDDNSITGVDIRDPNNMSIVAYLKDNVNLQSAIGLFLEGTTLYVAGGGGGSDRLTIVNTANLSALQVVGTVQDHTLLNDAHAVKVENGVAYLVSRGIGNSFVSVNVTNSSQPTILGSVVSDLLDGAHDFVLLPGKALVVGADSNKAVLIDRSNPSSMSIISSLSHANMQFPVSIKEIGTNDFVIASSNSDSLLVLALSSMAVSAPASSSLLNLTFAASPVTVANLSGYGTTGWTNLDLSSYVPSEAKGVLLNFQFRDIGSSGNETGLYLRHSAANEYMNASVSGHHINGIYRLQQVTLSIPASRIIQYSIIASGGNTATATIRLLGWYLER